MQELTCPIPSNINFLQSNGFLFDIHKLPDVRFFCQEVTLPSLDLEGALQSSPLVDVPIPGDKLNFGELSISFLLDETMINYISIHNWLVGLGFPESHEQFQNFLDNQTGNLNTTPLLAGYSDAVLQVLTSANNASRTIRFVDVFPTALSQITFQSTTDQTTYIGANASFRYSYYRFE